MSAPRHTWHTPPRSATSLWHTQHNIIQVSEHYRSKTLSNSSNIMGSNRYRPIQRSETYNPNLTSRVRGDARKHFGFAEDVANAYVRVIVEERIGGREREVIGIHGVAPGYAGTNLR